MHSGNVKFTIGFRLCWIMFGFPSCGRRWAMASLFRMIAGLLLLVAAVEQTAAQSDVAPKFAFVRELQKAVRTDNRAWLADHVQYPLRYHGRAATVIRNKAEFVRNYPTIVSDKLRASILAQEPEKIFENWQGMMVGDGGHNMWLRENGDGDAVRYEIVTINDMP